MRASCEVEGEVPFRTAIDMVKEYCVAFEVYKDGRFTTRREDKLRVSIEYKGS